MTTTPAPQKPNAARDAVLRDLTPLVARMELSWNRGDAASFASVFGEGADFIHFQGGHVQGRATIEAAHRQLFAGPYAKSRTGFTITGVKALNPNIVVLFLDQTLSFQVGGGAAKAVRSRATALCRRRDGDWKIGVFQATRVIAAKPRAKAPALQPVPQPAPKPVVQAAAKPAAKPAPKAEAKPAAKAKPQPKAKPKGK